MNRSHNTITAFCAVALYLSAGCASSTPKADVTVSADPRKLVQMIFVDRVKNQKTFQSAGEWQLAQIQPYFSSDVRVEINQYLNQRKSFYRRHSNDYLSIGILNDYITMAQYDPVTSCRRPPESSKIIEIQRTKESFKCQITYRLFGSSSLYDANTMVTLTLCNGQWLIAKVQYQKPAFPLLKNDQTMSGMLTFYTKELHSSYIWAEQHRDELLPNGVFHVGHGMYDR